MKVLLFSMPDPSPFVRAREWEIPNLAISSIAGNLSSHHEVRCADLIVRQWSVRRSVERAVKRFRPDVVGLSAMTFQYHTAQHIARMVRRLVPHAFTVLGGYHASLTAEELGERAEERVLWDAIVRGEGERTFDELLDALEGRRTMESVDGLSFRSGGRFVHNAGRALEEVDGIRLPARDTRMYRGFHHFLLPADIMETSRGCTFRCNFCSITRMYGLSFRAYSIERVLADIEVMARRGVRHVLIADDNITLDLPRLLDLCDAIAARRYRRLQFIVQATSQGLARDPTLPRRMAAAGVTSVFVGVENASKRNLATLRKANTVETTRTAARRCADEGIVFVAGTISGLPDDGAEEIRENFRFLTGLGVQAIMDQLITPYPGTDIRRELLAAGLVVNEDDYRLYTGYWPNVRTRRLSPSQLLYERWKARQEIVSCFRADGIYRRRFPTWARLWNGVIRPLVLAHQRHVDRRYGKRERFRREMQQLLNLNNYFDPPQSLPPWLVEGEPSGSARVAEESAAQRRTVV